MPLAERVRAAADGVIKATFLVAQGCGGLIGVGHGYAIAGGITEMSQRRRLGDEAEEPHQ